MIIATVVEGLQEDYAKSIGRISRNRFDDFDINEGDIVEVISGDKRVGIILKSIEEEPSDKIRSIYYPFSRKNRRKEKELILYLNGFLRTSLNVGLGQKVKIDKTICPEAEKVLLAPFNPEDNKKIFIEYLLNRPVVTGQIIELQNKLGYDLKVGILTTSPPGLVHITPRTDVRISRDKFLDKDLPDDIVMWDDIGGNHEILSRLRTLVEYPLRYPEIFEMLNIHPPQGILITGPPGVGKTYISRAIACESGVTRFFVMSTEIIKGWWTVEKEMDKYFDHILNYEPAILILDQIEVLAPVPIPSHTDLEKRLTNQLLHNLDKLNGRKIIVIGTTTDASKVHPALLVNGRMEVEISLPIPNFDDRLEILKIHTRGMPLADVNLQEVARSTGGYTPADLELLVKEAGMNSLERQNLLDLEITETSPISSEALRSHYVEVKLLQKDFQNALTAVKPSASREIITEIPKVTWDDIGGLEEVKQSLREMIEWPIIHSEVFDEMGIRSPCGVLLYGPPGTGKTLLAKALANEIQANFLVVKGPELLSKWFSESARMVRELFRRARQLAPCIIFFDEIDALATPRGGAYSLDSSRERDRIINQLLASLDGLEKMQGVYVVGATNRPNAIDPALLRPGRLDRLIYIPIPDKKSRCRILEVHTRSMKLQTDINLEELSGLLNNYTGADIMNLCREAAYSSLRRNPHSRTIEKRDFESALGVCRASINEDIIRYYQVQIQEMRKHRIKEYIIFPQEFI